ncbi:hypothetical protein BH10BAC3_BH10BAC3_39190 [soil metagenome]
MSDTPSGTLPTELINEKTFYTLGGASAAVLLTCWAINYVAVDVSWLNYKTYRLLGIILSELFAIIIMLQKKDRKSIQWLFAFLNGLLIFVNASGLNAMTSSYIFNPADTSKTKTTFFRPAPAKNNAYRQAGIFPLPRMISWWPDEKLMEQNQVLETKIQQLDSTNIALKTLLENRPVLTEGEGSTTIQPLKNPLEDSIRSLNEQLNEKQKQLTELTALLNKTGKDCELKLNDCLQEQYKYRDSILYYSGKYSSTLNTNDALQNNYNILLNNLKQASDNEDAATAKLKDCIIHREDLLRTLSDLQLELGSAKAKLAECQSQTLPATQELTLLEKCNQVCAAMSVKMIRPPGTRTYTDDDLLKQQDFIKTFCAEYNKWQAVRGIK